ncbi:unnamed protein product, partial [marine sediment metagenome]
FDEIVDFSEIERFIDTPIKRYSSGMLVRLGFSVSSCIEPDILLVDEVLAVGDASFRQKCMHRIQSLLKKGTSIVFVSHNLYMVQAVCTDSIYIKHGKIKSHGKTSDVIDRYERNLHEEKAQKFESEKSNQIPHKLDVEIIKVKVLNMDGLELPEEFYGSQIVEIQIQYRNFQW